MASEGGDEVSADGAGSFWSTFAGQSGVASLSPLEQLLQEPNCSVDALLDQEDIIQEVKSDNKELLDRLTEADALQLLIEMLTCDPPDDAPQARCYRRPFIAAELVTGANTRLTEALVKSEKHLATFWGFLDRAAEQPDMNPVLLGYFGRVATTLVIRHAAEVTEYLRKSGAEALLQKFLCGLHSRSIAELFARLLCTEQPSQMLFPVGSLVLRLLSQLQKDDPTSDAHENISLIVLELLTQKDTACIGNDVLKQLAGQEAVQMLMEQILSGRATSMSPAASILSSVVFHTCVDFTSAQDGAMGSTFSSTLPPLSPAALPLSGEEDLVNIGAEDILNEVTNEAMPLHRAGSPPRSPTSQPMSPPLSAGRSQEAYSASLIAEVSANFSKIRLLLDASGTSSSAPALSMPTGAVRPVGQTILALLSLLTMLVKSGHLSILEAIQREDLVSACMRVMLRHPWNTLVHNAARGLISEIMSSPEAPRPALIEGLLRDSEFRRSLLSEFSLEKESRQAVGQSRQRVGFMGHLYLICGQLKDFAELAPQCKGVLLEIPGWEDVILPALDSVNATQAEPLGGGISAQERTLTTAGQAGSAASSELAASSGASDHSTRDTALSGGSGKAYVFDDDDDDDMDIIPCALDSEYKKADDDFFNPSAMFDPNASSTGAGASSNEEWVADFSSVPAMNPTVFSAGGAAAPEDFKADFGSFDPQPFQPPPAPTPAAKPPAGDALDVFFAEWSKPSSSSVRVPAAAASEVQTQSASRTNGAAAFDPFAPVSSQQPGSSGDWVADFGAAPPMTPPMTPPVSATRANSGLGTSPPSDGLDAFIADWTKATAATPGSSLLK